MSSKSQRQVLIGKQANPGTGVNVDVALRAKANFRPVPDKIEVDEDIGSYAPGRHYIGSIKGEGGLDYDGYFEHVPYILSMSLGTGSVATGTAPDPDVWTFPIPEDAPNGFDLYTLEYTDGADHIVRAEDVIATGLEITGEAGKSWMFKPALAGGETTLPAALSATPSPPDPVTPIKMADTVLYIDDDYDDIGTTPVAELISFTWKMEDHQHQKQFSGSLYPNGRGNGKWKITLDLIVEVEVATIEAELDKLLTTAQSAIRIACEPSATNGIALDCNYMLKEISTLDDRDGNNIIKLTYQGEKDADDNTGEIVATVAELAAL